MRSLLLLTALGCLIGCRERLPETPGLEKARGLMSAAPSAEPVEGRSLTPPPQLEKALTGGRLVFQDNFERPSLGTDWVARTPNWRLEGGEVVNTFAKNAGLWLTRELPKGDVRIEFDVRSDPYPRKGNDGKSHEVFEGDLKCEAFNLAQKHQSGYVFIFGGWQNSRNRIARLEEHGKGTGARVVDGPGLKVEPSKTYRMKVLRVGKVLGWYAGERYLAHMVDDDLIQGPWFGFNNWTSHLTFDNLAVYALDAPAPRTGKPAPRVRGGAAPPPRR